LGRVLIGRIDVVDDDVTGRPAGAVGIAAVVCAAVDHIASGFQASLLGDVERRLGLRCGYEERDRRRRENRHAIWTHLTLLSLCLPKIMAERSGGAVLRGSER